MKTKITKNDLSKIAMIIVGSVVYTFGINIFIVPAGLYNGGFLGIAQILRTVAVDFLGLEFGFDISGIISFGLNIPLVFITYKTVGKQFIAKTMFCIAFQSVLLSVLPIPSEMLVDDLTSSIIGGLLCGFGVGLMLRNGGSSGGIDVLGMYYAQKSKFSVGRLSLLINIFVYGAAFFLMQDIPKIIYTLIFAGINTIAVDRMHFQNISSEVIIISKHNDAEIQNAIIHEMRRGVSYWDGYGAFTGESSRVLYTVVSKYELPKLKKVVARIDPKAFVSVKDGIAVSGNFEKRL